MLQTVPLPSNHACNRIGSNYNVQRDRMPFFLCKKAGRGTQGPTRQFPFAPWPRSCLVTLGAVLCQSHLRCTAAKRVARAVNANPISENNFSRGRILARLFKTSDLTGSCYGTPPPSPSPACTAFPSLGSPIFILYPLRRQHPPPLLFCFCRAGPFSPYHL